MLSESQESERKDLKEHTGEKKMDCKCEMRAGEANYKSQEIGGRKPGSEGAEADL